MHLLSVNIDYQKYAHYHYLFYHLLLMNKNNNFHKNLPIHMDMHLFSLILISSLLGGNSDNKCLKSLSSKFDARESNEPL